MTELERILVERDGLSLEEAKSLIDETREVMLEEKSFDPILDILGVDPDFAFDILKEEL